MSTLVGLLVIAVGWAAVFALSKLRFRRIARQQEEERLANRHVYEMGMREGRRASEEGREPNNPFD